MLVIVTISGIQVAHRPTAKWFERVCETDW